MRLTRLLLLLALIPALAHAQLYQGRQLVHAQLLANADALVPGQPVTLGLQLQPEPGWHTYWQYSGDAGIPTRIAWTFPPGFSAGPIQWPIPSVDNEPGGLQTYAYGPILLPITIQVPATLQPGQSVTLRARASWLVCKDLCVPGSADLAITLPVAAVSHPANAEAFAAAAALLPRQDAPPFHASWTRDGQTLLLKLDPPPSDYRFFPIPGDVQIGHPVPAQNTVRIPLLDPKSPATSIDGVVALHTLPDDTIPHRSIEAWQLSSLALAAMPSRSLLYWLALGFLGGLILNVMPCVLPVISLKIFGFIRQAGESPRRILLLGFTFIAGIFAWFLFLAALIVGFKAAGHQLNWAFQFQHPAFVAVMVVILLLFSLNLLGLFEIVLPAPIQRRVFDAAGGEGFAGTFLHGVFATLMATPCTAPFLGPALGFALVQPAPTVFAMFGSIAAGMSAPYALLAIRPAWLKYLPKPGIWMVRVKQTLGLLLLATVCWLGWVLVSQLAARPRPFQPQFEKALAQNRILFVDFTAGWCINCKVNERLVLDSPTVQDALRSRNVLLLKADWTSGPADITALLHALGRAGVPCYAVYPPGSTPATHPILLPEVITTPLVLQALDQAAMHPPQ